MSITKEQWRKWMKLPFHRYRVPIVGGVLNYYEIDAPNKTVARIMVDRETHPWIHVKGKIVDLGEVEKLKTC